MGGLRTLPVLSVAEGRGRLLSLLMKPKKVLLSLHTLRTLRERLLSSLLLDLTCDPWTLIIKRQKLCSQGSQSIAEFAEQVESNK